MNTISELAAHDLVWVRIRGNRGLYELRADDAVVATLQQQRRAGAEAVAADGHWSFTRAGFWHPRVIVRVAGSGAEIARFTARWTGTGTLESPAGSPFHWGASNIWQSQWAWQGGDGMPLVRIACGGRCVPGPGKIAGRVTIEPDAFSLPELSLLVLLGWYLDLLRAQDTAGSTAGVIAALG
jgi:hypothetical protein